MEKVIEYENKVFNDFEELFTDLLNSLQNTQFNNKITIVSRIKSINEQIEVVNEYINNLLIDIHKKDINASEKELDRIKDDENWKKLLTAFFPQMFLYNQLVINNDENLDETLGLTTNDPDPIILEPEVKSDN